MTNLQRLQSLLLTLVFVGYAKSQAVSEGTEFAFAFPPCYYSDFVPEIRVVGKENAQVSVQSNTGIDIINVFGNGFVIHTQDGSRTATSGVENIGYRLVSTTPISVHIGTQNNDNVRTPDQALLRPRQASDTKFYIVSYLGDTDTQSSDGPPLSFFMVTAYDDGTQVTVYDRENAVVYSGTLNRFDVYTHDAVDASTDYTGYRVESDIAVSVMAGHGRVQAGDTYQYICDMMPSIDDLGNSYLSFPVDYGVFDAGYIVRVLATRDNTEVIIPELGINRHYDTGDWRDFEAPLSFFIMEVQCSFPCYVVQITKATNEAGGTMFSWMGDSLVPLVPISQYSDNLLFVQPFTNNDPDEINTLTMLVVVADSYPVQGQLVLDGENMNSEVWFSSLGENYGFAILDVSAFPPHHTLEIFGPSGPGQSRFAAYLYSAWNMPDNVRVSKVSSIGHEGDYPSEGTKFVLALPPSSNSSGGQPYFQVNSKYTTTLVISKDDVGESLQLLAGESLVYFAPEGNANRVTTGVEDKGFEVTSGYPVSVTIGTSYHDTEVTPDDVNIRPLNPNGINFYVVNYLGTETPTIPNIDNDVWVFLVITASEADTFVEIFDTTPFGEERLVKAQVLQRFQTFTYDTASESNGNTIDLTGYHITSTKPVSVLTGNGYAYVGETGNSNGYILTQNVDPSELGTEYVTFPVGFGTPEEGYIVRIVAANTGPTLVVAELAGNFTLTFAGDHNDFDYDWQGSMVADIITCSQACYAVQLIKSSNTDPMLTRTGPAMSLLTHMDQFSTDKTFRTPWMDGDTICMLAIVAQPGSAGLELNGMSLDDFNWRDGDSGLYSTVVIHMSRMGDNCITHRLVATSVGRSFAAYIYTTSQQVTTHVTKAYSCGYGTASLIP